jgi:hypothetical protein
LVGCRIDWLPDWMAVGLVGCRIDWLVGLDGCRIGWLWIGWLWIGCPADWFVVRLISWILVFWLKYMWLLTLSYTPP